MKYKDTAILTMINDPVINIDLLQHLLGDFLGEGQYRYVFEFGKGKVAKVDVGNVLANASEWDTWSDVREHPKAAKWFAPALTCSTGAKLLVMQRQANYLQALYKYHFDVHNLLEQKIADLKILPKI